MTCCGGPRDAPDLDPDFEGPSDADIERFSDETRVCPSCKAEIWDDVSICPSCGMVLGDAAIGRGGLKGALITIGLIAGGVAFFLVFVL